MKIYIILAILTVSLVDAAGNCKPGMFRCQENRCVPHHFTCDGVFDCPFGDDEKGCLKFKKAEKDVEGIELRDTFSHGLEVGEVRPIAKVSRNNLGAALPPRSPSTDPDSRASSATSGA